VEAYCLSEAIKLAALEQRQASTTWTLRVRVPRYGWLPSWGTQPSRLKASTPCTPSAVIHSPLYLRPGVHASRCCSHPRRMGVRRGRLDLIGSRVVPAHRCPGAGRRCSNRCARPRPRPDQSQPRHFGTYHRPRCNRSHPFGAGQAPTGNDGGANPWQRRAHPCPTRCVAAGVGPGGSSFKW